MRLAVIFEAAGISTFRCGRRAASAHSRPAAAIGGP
jgi:hypothetical protein